MISKLRNLFSSPKKKKSPLKTELNNLKNKIIKEEYRLADIEKEFWANGGICCPSCGVPGFSEAKRHQDLRERRINEIEKKLHQSTSLTKEQRSFNKVKILKWLLLSNDLQPLGVDIISRYEYLTKKFNLNINHLKAYVEGKIGIKILVEAEIAHWCRRNQDFQLPAEKRTGYV